LELENRYGGFYDDKEIVLDFLCYAQLCFDRFGDRVKHWITINEVSATHQAMTDGSHIFSQCSHPPRISSLAGYTSETMLGSSTLSSSAA
jgi:beta-glucosidase